MIRLSSSELECLQEFLLSLYGASDLEALRRLIAEGASRLIASDRANFNQFDVSETHRMVIPEPVPAYWRQLSPILLAHMHEHTLGHPTRVPPLHTAVTFSDRHDAQWEKSTLYHEYYVPAGARHQLFVHLFQKGTVRSSLAFNRSRRDFSVRDRAILELVSPHVACAWHNVSKLQQLRSPVGLAVELTAERKQTAGEAAPGVDRLTHLGLRLTLREAEILDWVAEGKRNREIGLIIGISARTVGKHLEHIMQKLGVETRTSAACYWLEATNQSSTRASRL
jgi:DNA-binding CsgD family transcriptional regulator